MSPQTFLFFGRVGSGKGTQANLLMENLRHRDPKRKYLYIETGQKLREFVVRDNYSAGMTKEVLETGGLMPAFMPIWLWTGFLVENFTGEEHLVFDGICRRSYEAPVLDTALKFYKREKPVVIVIDTSAEWSVQRAIARGRSDDEIPEIKRRLEWFEKEVVPAIEYFAKDPYYTVININGEQTIEEVHQEIVQKLGW